MKNHLSATLLCLISLGESSLGAAHPTGEQPHLAMILQQLRFIETLSHKAQVVTNATDARYTFDYPRFTRDLEHLRQGLTDYLHPSRAQPRDPAELSGDYRHEPDEARQ